MTAAAAVAERTILLSQIIAVRATVKTDTEQAVTKAHHLLHRGDLLKGLARTYKPEDEEGFVFPSEVSYVQVKAESVLRDIAAHLARLFNTTAAMDWTNQHARADIVITSAADPFVLVPDVPVSYLMFLEKQLVHLDTLIRKLPVLDVTEKWEFDPATDTYRSLPISTTKTTKVRRNHTLAAATDRHPAQVEVYTEDVPVGKWTTVRFSGALPANRVNAMLSRVKALTVAVKFAREQANLEGILDPEPGRRILDYIFAAEA